MGVSKIVRIFLLHVSSHQSSIIEKSLNKQVDKQVNRLSQLVSVYLDYWNLIVYDEDDDDD